MEKVKVCWVIPTEPSLRESIQAACPQAQIDFCERTALDEQRVADAEVVIGNLPKRWLPEGQSCAGCIWKVRGRNSTRRKNCWARTCC